MGRLSVIFLAVVLAIGSAAPVFAQEETLADIRQELSFLYVDLQRLKRELSTTGGINSIGGGGSALERINQIETELVRLTSKTEQLENRINRVVKDGTNRVGDLEFRLVELEGGDISALGETTALGGDVDTGLSTAPAEPDVNLSPELALGEQGDFDRAQAALDAGDFADAAAMFQSFSDTYTGGPLTGEAHYFRGEALSGLADTANAARAYLESFSGSPNGPKAPDALFGLGVALGELGQTNEACISLGEVSVRFPGASVVSEAAQAMLDLGCP